MKLSHKGFTLVEVLLASAILAFCLSGLLLTYINMFILSDLARDLTLATNAVQAKMEELKNTSFDCLSTFGTFCNSCTNCFYNGQIFNNIAGFNISDAKGVVYITDTGYHDLKRVRIEVSFKSRNRVVGGDKNLDGQWQTEEDFIPVNGVNELTSPVELVTLIAQ